MATVPERVCQNNAACSYLLGFLLGFLDSKRCGTRSKPGPRLVLVLLVLHAGTSDPPPLSHWVLSQRDPRTPRRLRQRAGAEVFALVLPVRFLDDAARGAGNKHRRQLVLALLMVR